MQCDYQECDCDDCCGMPIRGFQGLEGTASFGIPGPQGYAGPEYVAPQGAQGMQGPICCDMESLRGPQGTQGPQGYNIDGPQGPIGFQGLSLNGFFGPQGQDGYQGYQGLDHVGMQGFQGSTEVGLKGPQGFQGNGGIGIQGSMGPQGPTQIFIAQQGPSSFTLPSNFQGQVQSISMPSLDKYLVTITFSVTYDLSSLENISFYTQPFFGDLIVLVQNGNLLSNRMFVSFDLIVGGQNSINLNYITSGSTPTLSIYDFLVTLAKL